MRAQRRGAAGRRGQDVRSDCFLELEVRDSGGLELVVRSRVAAYYGESIRRQVEERLRALGLEHARIELDDSGALPFVLDARLEAAARRAGVVSGAGLAPAVVVPLAAPSPKDRLRRSRLYLPGNEPKFFLNAGLYRPDAVILDLEDSVHPDDKDAARLLVRNALGAVDFLGAERMVRVNQPPRGLEDLRAVVPAAPDLILLPKVERPEDVADAGRLLDELTGGGDARPVWLMPILESALGVERALAIATASPRVAALTIGLEDYAADLGVPRSAEGHESLWARQRLVNAARAAGVQAIDSVYGDVDDLAGLARWGASSRALGFVGMGCLHPRQVAAVHEAYAPTRAEIERALRVVAAFEEAEAEGRSVVSLGSKMVDPPVVKQALRLVEQARQAGRLPAAAAVEGEPR